MTAIFLVIYCLVRRLGLYRETMRKINTDFTKIIRKIHENKWVALSSNRSKVVAYADTFANLSKVVGEKHVVYMKVPPLDTALAFS